MAQHEHARSSSARDGGGSSHAQQVGINNSEDYNDIIISVADTLDPFSVKTEGNYRPRKKKSFV